MSDIRKVMNAEIRRLAKKEIKAALAPILATNSALRKRVAEQEKRIRQLEAGALKATAQTAVPASEKAENVKEKQIRLTPERIRKIRTKLAISQAQFAKILGVNTQSVNFWENGKTTPRSILKKTMAAIRDLGPREIAQLFAEKEIVVKKAAKAGRPAKAAPKAQQKAPAAAAKTAPKAQQKATAVPAPKKAEKKVKKAAPAAAAPVTAEAKKAKPAATEAKPAQKK